MAIKDRAEFYRLPENHAVDVLSKEILEQQKRIQKYQNDIHALYEKTELPFSTMVGWVDQIHKHQKRIQECRDAIKWIYGEII